MKQKETIRSLWMPTAGMLTGARRAAMLLLTTLLLTMTAQTALAVSYLDASGASQSHDATPVTDISLGADNSETWYVVNSDVELTSRLRIRGNVHLILTDKTTLSVNANDHYGIYMYENSSLTIYSQSLGSDMGKLVISSKYYIHIGANSLTINGGDISVTINNNAVYLAAGGSMTINNGTVSLTGTDYGVSNEYGSLTITGGTVTITAQTPIYNVNNYTKTGGTVTLKDKSGNAYYKVLFDANGGSDVSAALVVSGGTVSKPEDPTRDGYVFVGWYNGANEYDFTAAVTTDLTLTAHWRKLLTHSDISASVPNQTMERFGGGYPYPYIYFKFEDAENNPTSNVIGEVVKDGETTLTLGTDYEFGQITFAEPSTHDEKVNPCKPGDKCRVEIIGLGTYVGTAYADFTIISPSANGTYGDLSWSVADGTLSITGTGAMTAAATTAYPWYQYCSIITSVTIGDGVTSIADNAFGSVPNMYTYNNVAKVTIPASVTSIGADAFKGCITATDVYCYADPEKLTWSDTGDDFKSDGSTVCHVANASAWNNNDKFSNVHVTFEGNLANVSIPYIDADGTTAYCTDFTELRTDNPEHLNFSNLPGGWYVVENWNTDNNVNSGADFYGAGLTFQGDTHLILCDEAEMSVNSLRSIGTLTIYGQSGSSGAINIYNESTGINASKDLTINGGIISVSSDTGYPIDCGGNVVINGGRVTATTSGQGADAIFGLIGVVINGGKVTATAPDGWAIDGLNNAINGGTVITNGPVGTVTIAEQMIDCTSGTKRVITESIDGNMATALQTLFGNNASVDASFSRSFTANVASTICLPFAVSQQKAAEVGTFYDFTSVNGDWTEVTMTEVNTLLTANTPYLFKSAATGEQTFSGTATNGATAGTKTVGDWTFTGTYEEKRWDATHNSGEIGTIFGFATGQGYEGTAASQDASPGDFIRLNSGGIKPFRAYLKYTGTLARTRGEGGLPERMTVRLVNANGEIQGIGEIRLSTGEVTFDSRAWYDLNGRRLDGQPSEKGIYINGGRKVVIK